MLSRFHLILERYGQTDGQNGRTDDGRIDGQHCYINIARLSCISMLTRDTNGMDSKQLLLANPMTIVV